MNTMIPATKETVDLAIDTIANMSAHRKMAFATDFDRKIPTFPSKAQEKKFRKRLNRVIRRCTMRSANTFLSYFGAEMEYSPKEKAIIASKKAWKESLKQMLVLKAAYIAEKGDFYKD